MLEALFGSRSAEQVLLYLQCYGEGHASVIARTFGTSVSQIRKQLTKLESGGLIVNRVVGNARVYTWSPRFLLRRELAALLQGALDRMPEEEKQAYFRERRRPRRTGKPF